MKPQKKKARGLVEAELAAIDAFKEALFVGNHFNGKLVKKTYRQRARHKGELKSPEQAFIDAFSALKKIATAEEFARFQLFFNQMLLLHKEGRGLYNELNRLLKERGYESNTETDAQTG